MALRAKSFFLWGLEVRADNQNLPFRAVALGPQLNAVIPAGFYSLTSLLVAIKGAMQVADPAHTYTVTANRTISGGTENRITISSSGVYLDLLFATGTLAATSIRDLISFGIFDYTGSNSYTNAASSGFTIVTEWWGKNYQGPEIFMRNFGTTNISTNGEKESITWSIQRFIAGEWEFEPEAKVLSDWPPLLRWMIEQKPFDFTPEISSPSIVYEVTLDKSSEDGQGLAFKMREMVPRFPFMYTTGPMTFRVRGDI